MAEEKQPGRRHVKIVKVLVIPCALVYEDGKEGPIAEWEGGPTPVFAASDFFPKDLVRKMEEEACMHPAAIDALRKLDPL
jgi:hypothetical protein